MATESVTIPLDGSNVNGTKWISGDKNDAQIVTFTDGGDISGTITVAKFGKDAPTNPGEGPGGDDRFVLDLSQFNDDFSLEFKSIDAGDTFQIEGYDSVVQVGSVYTYTYTGTDGQVHTVSIDTQSLNGAEGVDVARVVCFGAGTRIMTPGGELAIEELHAGDAVLCGDGQIRPIRWIGSRHVTAAELAAQPELRPIRFAPNSMGPGVPQRTLTLSPQHQVVLSDWRIDLLYGCDSVLARARHLCDGQNVSVCEVEEVTYFHLLLDGHHTVLANGLETETLYAADMVRTALSAEARANVAMVLPELASDMSRFGPPWAPGLRGYQVEAWRRYCVASAA